MTNTGQLIGNMFAKWQQVCHEHLSEEREALVWADESWWSPAIPEQWICGYCMYMVGAGSKLGCCKALFFLERQTLYYVSVRSGSSCDQFKHRSSRMTVDPWNREGNR